LFVNNTKGLQEAVPGLVEQRDLLVR